MKNNIEIQTGVYYKTKNGSMVEPLQNVYWIHPIAKVGFYLFLEPQSNILYTNSGIAIYNENLKHSEQNLKDLEQLNIVSKYVFDEQELIDYKAQLLADRRLVSLARLQN
jgi:hypothetical protein